MSLKLLMLSLSTDPPTVISHEDAVRLSGIMFDGAGRTKQSMKDECDINNVVARYKKTGMISHLSKNAGRYADVSEITDFRDAVERVAQARDFFLGLPAHVRRHFSNDPAAFLDCVQDPSRVEELKELGLVKAVERPAEPAAPAEPAE